jgi:hypothetical protein
MYQKLLRNLSHIPGWKTKKKIVVFESDDWGSIRMPNNLVRDKLIKFDQSIEDDLYCKFDNLENKDDLSALFNVLKRHKDKNGKSPVITANTVIANPNFDKIKKSNFEEYHYESFIGTLNSYYPNDNVLNFYKEGINENIFFPQFHAREHVNVKMWLSELQHQNNLLLEAFNLGVFGIPLKILNNNRGNFMAAFDIKSKEDLTHLDGIVEDGLSLFQNIFGFQSKTIICPCYVWPSEINKVLAKNGVQAFQGMKFQFKPTINKAKYTKIFHYTGQKEEFNLRYLVRNAFFEPTHFPHSSHLEELLFRIESAFNWNNPVIIGTHRINFIGSLNESNRNTNLKKFDVLLSKILKKYPDIEFYSSAELITEIKKTSK